MIGPEAVAKVFDRFRSLMLDLWQWIRVQIQEVVFEQGPISQTRCRRHGKEAGASFY